MDDALISPRISLPRGVLAFDRSMAGAMIKLIEFHADEYGY